MDELRTIDRRTFIRYSATITLSAALQGFSLMADAKKENLVYVTLLHTNDWHSRIEPFPNNDRDYPGMGGAERRATLIEKIRGEEKNVLLVDAGDIFQGTPYFNFYGGELEYKLMSTMGYDCVTLGNHDFDNGIEGIVKMLPHATFDFVNCNYDFTNTKLSEVVKPYKIIEKSGVKIGILGVGIDLKGLVPEKNYLPIKYLDPVFNSDKIAKKLKEDGCDIIICLSHLGYQYKGDKISDRVLAEQSENIDVIIGGHTHSFLKQAEYVKNKIGQLVLINQVGWAGLCLGRIDFSISKGKILEIKHQSSTISI